MSSNPHDLETRRVEARCDLHPEQGLQAYQVYAPRYENAPVLLYPCLVCGRPCSTTDIARGEGL